MAMNSDELVALAFPGEVKGRREASQAFSGLGDVYFSLAWRFLFWPDFFVVHDAVFVSLNGNSVEYVSGVLDRVLTDTAVTSNRWSEVVWSFNYFELPYMVPTPRQEAREADDWAYDSLADSLRESWTARLGLAFPDRKLWVTVDGPDDDLELRLTLNQEAILPARAVE